MFIIEIICDGEFIGQLPYAFRNRLFAEEAAFKMLQQLSLDNEQAYTCIVSECIEITDHGDNEKTSKPPTRFDWIPSIN